MFQNESYVNAKKTLQVGNKGVIDWRSMKNNNITLWGLKQSSQINARELVILLIIYSIRDVLMKYDLTNRHFVKSSLKS